MTSMSPMCRITVREQDAVATEHVARVSDHGACLARVVVLREPGDRVGVLPGLLQACELHAVQLHAGDLREHADEALLDELKAAEGLGELDALLAVGQSRVVRRHGVPERGPRARRAGGGA